MDDTIANVEVPPPTVNKLIVALSSAMSIARTVPKDGYNAFSKYRYPSAAAVNAEARRVLSQLGIVARVRVTANELAGGQTQGGKGKQTARVEILLELWHESGQSMTFGPFVGYAIDTEEKATAKAHTVALKTALIQTLLLDAGDDPEDDRDDAARRQEPKPDPKPDPKTEPKTETAEQLRRREVVMEVATRCQELIGLEATREEWPRFKDQLSASLSQSWEAAIFASPRIASAKSALAFKLEALELFERNAIARAIARKAPIPPEAGLTEADELDDDANQEENP